MNRLCIATRGVGNWRERLAKPDDQWERFYSAFETAVSWEGASSSPAGLPEPIVELFRDTPYDEPKLLLAIAEHKVELKGRGGDSQCDVWALINTKAGGVSLSVEAKAKEKFGQDNESLAAWLEAGQSDKAKNNRQTRWDCIRDHLPIAEKGAYSNVAYQLLHRCAAAVIEAKRYRLTHAAFIVQAFESPDKSFEEFSRMCHAMGIEAERGRMHFTKVQDVNLGIGWADCPFATNEQVAAVV